MALNGLFFEKDFEIFTVIFELKYNVFFAF